MPRARRIAFQWNFWLLGVLTLFFLVAILPIFNPDPAERSLVAWNLEPGIGRQASLTSTPSGDGFELNVISLDSLDPWRVRITRPISLAKDELLTIRFIARAEMDHAIELVVREGQAPYNLIGRQLSIPISSAWTKIEYSVVAAHTLIDGRIEIQAGQSPGKLEIKEVKIEKTSPSLPNTASKATGDWFVTRESRPAKF